jgi:putative transposase
VCFPLSLRNVEYLLHERGIDAGHETVRIRWCCFGPKFASEIRKRRFEGVRSGRWRWRLDEMHLKINGDMRDLWRAVDHIGEAPECIVAKTRDMKAVLKNLGKQRAGMVSLSPS